MTGHRIHVLEQLVMGSPVLKEQLDAREVATIRCPVKGSRTLVGILVPTSYPYRKHVECHTQQLVQRIHKYFLSIACCGLSGTIALTAR